MFSTTTTAAVATTKIYVIPVYKRHWIYVPKFTGLFSQLEEHYDTKYSQQSSHKFSNSNFVNNFKYKFDNISNKIKDKAYYEWDNMSKASKSSMKGRLYASANSLLERIDPTETFLKDVGVTWHKYEKKQKKEGKLDDATDKSRKNVVEVVYPSGLMPDLIAGRMEDMLAFREGRHKLLLIGSIVTLPLSIIAGILPGPNVFLVYNAFRLYSHMHAWKGAKQLRNIMFSDLTIPNSSTPQPKHKSHEHERFDYYFGKQEQYYTQHQQNKQTSGSNSNNKLYLSPHCTFTADEELGHLVDTEERRVSCLKLEQSDKIGKHLSIDKNIITSSIKRTILKLQRKGELDH